MLYGFFVKQLSKTEQLENEFETIEIKRKI